MLGEHPTDGLQERLAILQRVANAGRAWKWSTFSLAGLLGVSLLGNLVLGALPKWKPYYVEIDTCRGDVRVVGPAPETLAFADLAVRSMVRRFVEDLRTVTEDPEANKAAFRRASHQLTPEGKTLFSQYEQEFNILAQREPVVVKVLSVLAREPTRYDVRWQEQQYSAKHELKKVVVYRGLFHFQWGTPRTEEERTHAPLGMFFHFWQWTPES